MMKVSSAPPPPQSGNRLFLALPVVALLLMVGLITSSQHPHRHDPTKQPGKAYISGGGKLPKLKPRPLGEGSGVVIGKVDKVPYYHCPKKQDKDTKNIVLLHGSVFSKETWKDSGILEQLCSIDNLQVTALDLDVRVRRKRLRQILDQIAKAGLVTLPVSALVTPSASGTAVVDWMQSNEAKMLPKYIHVWIPVASGSVLKAKQKALSGVRAIDFDILAIHGNKDPNGRKSSELLHKLTGATVKELKGRHPCYLDSPTAFIQTILSHLEISQQ